MYKILYDSIIVPRTYRLPLKEAPQKSFFSGLANKSVGGLATKKKLLFLKLEFNPSLKMTEIMIV